VKPKLSIVIPAIRVDRWDAVCQSLNLDFLYELIFISPYSPTAYMNSQKNIKFIRDWGSPVRTSCIGANNSEGRYLTWSADDGTFFSKTVAKAVSLLDGDINGRQVIVAKYLEACTEVHPDWYYQLNVAYPKTPYIPDSWKIFNCAFMHRDYYDTLGGWDCCFETTAVSHADLAARAQRDGCTVNLIQDPMLNCSHMPGVSGDHGPIYHAHVQNDEPTYKRIYGDASCISRTHIDINNWKKSPTVWTRRFG
jgi:hypothetical protein